MGKSRQDAASFGKDNNSRIPTPNNSHSLAQIPFILLWHDRDDLVAICLTHLETGACPATAIMSDSAKEDTTSDVPRTMTAASPSASSPAVSQNACMLIRRALLRIGY